MRKLTTIASSTSDPSNFQQLLSDLYFEVGLAPRLMFFGDLPFLHVAMVGLFEAAGLTSLARRLEDWGTIQAVERLNLDGLLALWHPPMTN